MGLTVLAESKPAFVAHVAPAAAPPPGGVIPTARNIRVAESSSNGSTLDITLCVVDAGGDPIIVYVHFTDSSLTAVVSSVVLDPGGLGEGFVFVAAQTNEWSAGNIGRVECWQLISPSSGTFTVRITWSEVVLGRGAMYAQYDADHIDPTGATAGVNGNSDTPSVAVVTTVDDSLVVGAPVHRNISFSPAAPGADDTERYDDSTAGSTRNIAYYGADTPAATVGSFTVSATGGASSNWAALGVELLSA